MGWILNNTKKIPIISPQQKTVRLCRLNQSNINRGQNESKAFVAVLKISSLEKDDEQNFFNLSITNELGTTYYVVRIANIEGEELQPRSN